MRLKDEAGTWHDLSGRPFVLAHVDRWAMSERDTDSLRAQLRGLGAHLLVVTPQRATLLGPDHAPRGVDVDTRSGRDRAIRIVDADLRTRWLHEAPPDAGPYLVSALREAVQQRRAVASVHDVSRNEQLVASLMAAFALTLV